jgi:4,5-dihydroxyphthalate decarboxylase
MVMRSADVRADPETVRAVWHLLSEGKRAAGTPADPDPVPFGIEANRKSLELISEYAFQLKLIPHRVSVDEMFAETAVLVGN